jgi:hypothetical protein
MNTSTAMSGIDVVITHETNHLAPSQLRDPTAAALTHDLLPEPAQTEHSITLTRLDQVALAASEGSSKTTNIALSPSVVLAFVGPRPVVLESSPTTAFEIASASSPSPGDLRRSPHTRGIELGSQRRDLAFERRDLTTRNRQLLRSPGQRLIGPRRTPRIFTTGRDLRHDRRDRGPADPGASLLGAVWPHGRPSLSRNPSSNAATRPQSPMSERQHHDRRKHLGRRRARERAAAYASRGEDGHLGRRDRTDDHRRPRTRSTGRPAHRRRRRGRPPAKNDRHAGRRWEQVSVLPRGLDPDRSVRHIHVLVPRIAGRDAPARPLAGTTHS